MIYFPPRLTSSNISSTRWFPLSLLAGALAIAGCGGNDAPPRTQADTETLEDRPRAQKLQTSSEIGGLDEERVEKTFKRALPALQACLAKGAERVEFLGGGVSFFLKIDASGRVDHAHLEKSTLGDRATEKCMLGALRKKQWPEPVGGEHGLARKSFDFDPPNDVRPPTDWDGGELDKALEEVKDQIDQCKDGASGSFEATLYVSTEGTVLAGSVTPPDESGEHAVDCLVDALKSAHFSSPGSWPGKVTFQL